MITIDKSSWHYRFMKFLGLEARYSSTICGYLRGLLLWAPLWLALCAGGITVAVLIAVVVPWGIGDFIGWAIACLVEWQFIYPNTQDTPWAFGLFVAIISMVGPSFWWLTKESSSGYYEPGFIAQAWESLHGKICARVTYK